MVQNGPKWSKMVQMVENGPNGQKWSKMVKNGRPDLKRAQHTGLSARRAQRTKSRGPKGVRLEVGARRAPRLLFYNMHSHHYIHYFVSQSYKHAVCSVAYHNNATVLTTDHYLLLMMLAHCSWLTHVPCPFCFLLASISRAAVKLACFGNKCCQDTH